MTCLSAARKRSSHLTFGSKVDTHEDQDKGEVVVETLPTLSQALRGYLRASRMGAPVRVPG